MANEKQSLKDKVHVEILNSIIQGEYKPGQILNEQELITKFGYSKSPIREALVSLCNEGVLRNLPRYGYEVVRITKSDIDDIMRFRTILECGCLTECFNYITNSQIEQLQHINEACLTKSNDTWSQWDNNQAFHLKMISYCHNEYAYNELEHATSILKRAYAQSFWDSWDSADKNIKNLHTDIISSMNKHNLEKTLDALKADLSTFRI